MFKQICFFRKREDMTAAEFLDYYENQHSQLAARMGKKRAIAAASRYVRRYLVPERNPVTGEIHDPGYDCIMEIWWNSREDFEASQEVIRQPDRLLHVIEDERNLFSSHANPVCSVIEYDSPMGPNGEPTRVEVAYDEEEAS